MFLFLVICKALFIIPVVKENTRVKLALAIPAGAPITLEKEIIDTRPFVADIIVKVCQYNQMQQCICFLFYSLFFFPEFLS